MLDQRLVGAASNLRAHRPGIAGRQDRDATQPAVRAFGLAAGWVDFKICAIDETWSGLVFARRNAKADRAAR